MRRILLETAERIGALLIAIAMLSGGAPGTLAGDVAAPLYEPSTRPAEVVRYENEGQLQLLALRGPTVVFFFASWCPNCKITLAELDQRWSEVKPGITIVIANYDTENALKAQLGVTYQDTFVQVGPNGERLAIWNAGGVDGLNANVVGF